MAQEAARVDDAAQEENILLYACIGAYMLLMAVITILAYRRKRKALATGTQALAAQYGGTFSPVLLTLTTFSSVFSGYTVMGVPQEASMKGYFAMRWFPAIFVIALGMMVYYPRIRQLGIDRGYRSPNDFVTDRYRSKVLRICCSLCTCLPQLFYLTCQLVSFAELLSGITLGAVPKLYGMIIFAVIVLAMEKVGGMNSVVLSDAVQAMFMIVGFLVMLVVLTTRYGTLDAMTPADCPTLGYVNRTSVELLRASGDQTTPPARCAAGGAAECAAFGCIGAVAPSFLALPSAGAQAAHFFLIFNEVAFPLNPHMVQRAYIASSGEATFSESWPLASQGGSAFAAIGNELKRSGPFEYFLVAMLTCSALAAIMSTADSVILGASNALSIDIFQGVLRPGASQEAIVRCGAFASVAMTVAGIALGVNVTSADFGTLLTMQNGIILQAVPAFLLGLFCDVSTQAITAGILCGIVGFVLAWTVGNPLAPLHVPVANVGALANFAVVAVAQGLIRRCEAPQDAYGQSRFGERLCAETIRKSMKGTEEPDRVLLALSGVCVLLTVPFYGALGLPVGLSLGFPTWVGICFLTSISAAVLAFWAAWTWRSAEVSGASEGGCSAPPVPSDLPVRGHVAQADGVALDAIDVEISGVAEEFGGRAGRHGLPPLRPPCLLGAAGQAQCPEKRKDCEPSTCPARLPDEPVRAPVATLAPRSE